MPDSFRYLSLKPSYRPPSPIPKLGSSPHEPSLIYYLLPLRLTFQIASSSSGAVNHSSPYIRGSVIKASLRIITFISTSSTGMAPIMESLSEWRYITKTVLALMNRNEMKYTAPTGAGGLGSLSVFVISLERGEIIKVFAERNKLRE